MNKFYKVLSLFLAISMLFSIVIFAEDGENAQPAVMTLSADKTTVMEGDTLTLKVTVNGVTETVTGGTIGFTKTDNTAITFGNITYSDGYTAGIDGAFTMNTPAVIPDNTVICEMPVTIGNLPDGTTSDNIQLANLIAASCMLTKDVGNVELTVAETPITITVNKKVSDGKITLLSTVSSIGDFKVEFVKNATEKVSTALTLLSDKKTIKVDLAEGQSIQPDIEYTVVVTGAGYLTSNSFKFTSSHGIYNFNIGDFLAGNIDSNGTINIYDFNDLCTVVLDNDAEITNTYDLNHDGSLSESDVTNLVKGWTAGRAK